MVEVFDPASTGTDDYSLANELFFYNLEGELNTDHHLEQFVYYYLCYPLLRNVRQSCGNALISTSVFVASDTRFLASRCLAME
jgi:hypothetical protein